MNSLHLKKKYRIALPKGALIEGSKIVLAKAGIEFEMPDKKLILQTTDPDVEILLVRQHDVPIYVENGAADLGIVGSDMLQEKLPDVLILADLGFGQCDLVVASPKDSEIKTVADIADYSRIATKFPHLTRQFFRGIGSPVEIIELYGSIEIAPITGLSEAIVDLVATGKTLRENGLIPLEKISSHSARLIANRVSWQINHEWTVEILNKLQENLF